MNFHIITLFKKSFDSYLNESILARATKRGLIHFCFYNPRDFSLDKHRRVDGRPYGGGPGMVMQALPLLKASRAAKSHARGAKMIIFSPTGKQFTNAFADKLIKKYKSIILISGRYEGIDARLKRILKAEEVSIGPYVLTGGELPAMVLIDGISRRIPGVLGNPASLEEERISSSEVYTRPEVLIYRGKKYRVPKVLLSGHHKKMDAWKKDKLRIVDKRK